jgi:sterol desaturase/sphingolipid hydroxylase (fatty acid hydroxylase superfamily)
VVPVLGVDAGLLPLLPQLLHPLRLLHAHAAAARPARALHAGETDRALQASAQGAAVAGCLPPLLHGHSISGIRTGLPLPSAGEVAAQLLAYMLMEDYLGYWFHRCLHSEWFYDKIHYVHHEFRAPMGFAAAHAHWSESLVLGFAAFVSIAIVPCHITTCWIWFAIRGAVGVEIHCG